MAEDKVKSESEKTRFESSLKKVATNIFRKEFGVEDIFSEEPNFEPTLWPGGEHTLSRDCVLALQDQNEHEHIVSFTSFNKEGGRGSLSVRFMDLTQDQFFEYSEPGSDKVVDRLANAVFILRKEARTNPTKSRIDELGWSINVLGTKFDGTDDVDRINQLMELIGALEAGNGKVIGKQEDISFVANKNS
ncbi:MAG: hypothetical protein AAB548_01920 [Patescibacteria group bacterium]